MKLTNTKLYNTYGLTNYNFYKSSSSRFFQKHLKTDICNSNNKKNMNTNKTDTF